ncbi:ABC-2 type transport system permease protein [Actinocorallia herbida]|uniref:Transport permease protein n=1 Tax=Actinocorallia herbida TaxID=58109 RepID=A0A3N1CQL5_9ACTN|nr:ABC transporter permease [Actinocorallia herbida]ROO83028.1 ABC-2 type transport system permease protein [Actinocorallia herbida]
MSTAHALRDSLTMLRRDLRHQQRYPSMTISIVIMPVLFLLLFVYVFGGAIGPGIGLSGPRADYVNYVIPGILLMAVATGTISTAVAVCTDLTEGIVQRFRSMPVSPGSVVTGHVAGNMIQVAFILVLIFGIAFATGFRPDASPIEWLAALGLLFLTAFGLSWLSAALGLRAKTPEAASNAPTPLTFLPFLGSAVVTPESMPSGLRWFAEHQPFTPITETLRGLLLGTPIGSDAYAALAWCLGLALVGYLWARVTFARLTRS